MKFHMLHRRLQFCYRYFGRTLFSSSRKISQRYILQSKHPLLLVSLAVGGTSFLYCKPSILCEDENHVNVVEEADRLYSANEFKELHEYLLQFKNSDDHELLWRIARAHRDRSNMVDVTAEEKKQLIFDAMEISRRALELGEDNYACHKWYGIMLSETGDYLGTKVKLNNAPAMKEHFERAAELCPSDATTHYLIGMWCYNFANLRWYERQIATAVFGTPPTSTYEEALVHFEKAEKMDPSFYSANQYMIGLMHLKLGNKCEAKQWFEKLLNFKVKKEEDDENVRKAQDELKSL